MDCLPPLLYDLITMAIDLAFLHGNHGPRCDARVDKHFDGYCTLQFMSVGGVELFYDERRYLMEGAWYWPAFPGPRVRFHPAPGYKRWDHRYVAFNGPLVNRWVAAKLFLDAPQRAISVSDDPRQFDELLDHARRRGRWGTLRAINLLERILLQLAEARSATQSPEAWLTSVMKRLDQTDSFVIDYAALAEEHGMALSTLRRRFRQATGIPLHSYLLQSRIAQARTLLGETDLPIKTIAHRIGYHDVYFFSRQFRQETGVPPATYRRSGQWRA